jgi:SAM-dependent methyltransferase
MAGMMLDRIHEALIRRRRATMLGARLAREVPLGATILDVGAGDGAIARAAASAANGRAVGLEVSRRAAAVVPLAVFDGVRLPARSRCIDCLLLVDVLHHAKAPWKLLEECARVTAGCIVIKDHLADAPLARLRLRFMDGVGNDRFGVPSPGTYWTRAEWRERFEAAGLRIEAWDERVDALPLLLRPVFGWGLHFIARLVPEHA